MDACSCVFMSAILCTAVQALNLRVCVHTVCLCVSGVGCKQEITILSLTDHLQDDLIACKNKYMRKVNTLGEINAHRHKNARKMTHETSVVFHMRTHRSRLDTNVHKHVQKHTQEGSISVENDGQATMISDH